MDISADGRVSDLSAPSASAGSAPSSASPDILCTGLDLVFACLIRTCPSSAHAMFANSGNRFWPTAHEAGLIPQRYSADTIKRLPEIGMGAVFLSGTHRSADGKAAVNAHDLAQFDAKLLRYRPRAIAFIGKHAASTWMHRSAARLQYGRQAHKRNDIVCEVFVLPPTMLSARRYWNAEPWHQLANWIGATRPWRF